LTFAENESYFARAEQSAAAVIVDGPSTSTQDPDSGSQRSLAFAGFALFFRNHRSCRDSSHCVPASAAVDATAHVARIVFYAMVWRSGRVPDWEFYRRPLAIEGSNLPNVNLSFNQLATGCALCGTVI
jgi:hypothetical protein